jgi:hypothetical protein
VDANRLRVQFAPDHFWPDCPCDFLLAGQQVMAMFRRSPGSVTPFRQRREELARREAELRDGLEKLERMIAEAPRVARRRQEELSVRARDSRLNASVEQDKRYRNDAKSTSRRRPLRKERREGRLLFLVLVIAIAVVVIWLMSHLHF